MGDGNVERLHDRGGAAAPCQGLFQITCRMTRSSASHHSALCSFGPPGLAHPRDMEFYGARFQNRGSRRITDQAQQFRAGGVTEEAAAREHELSLMTTNRTTLCLGLRRSLRDGLACAKKSRVAAVNDVVPAAHVLDRGAAISKQRVQHRARGLVIGIICFSTPPPRSKDKR